MGILTQNGNTIIYQTFGERVELCPFGKDRIRYRSSANLHIQDQNWNLLEQPETDCTIEMLEDRAIMTNGRIKAVIRSNGMICYYNDKDEELLGEDWYDENNQTAYLHHGREYRHADGDNYRTSVYFKAYEDEHLYGLGQIPHNCFNLKGCTVDLCQKNTHVSIPYLFSSRGYGFLWNNPAVGRVEVVRNHTMWYVDAAPQIDYVIMTGDSSAEIIRQVSQLTGFAPEFPEWASGFWQCKLRYKSQEELLGVAREYKKRGIPISAIVIDFFHWTEEGDWKFDPKYWPDPKAMVEELNEMGIRLIVSVWPTVRKKSENYRALAEKNELVRMETGLISCMEHDEDVSFIDPTNPETRSDVWQIIERNYCQYGVKNFWLDVAEPEFRPYQYENMRTYIGNGLQVSQIYPYYYEKMIYDGLKHMGETEIISLSRSAWFGSQRVGTLLWSGDIPSSFLSLRRQIKAGLNMSLCGIPWWTTDIGGFIGGKPSDPEFRELIVRWFQFGLFLPVMRLHGARVWDEGESDTDDGSSCGSCAHNEIWSFGEENYPRLKALIEDREKLRGYVMDGMRQASADGTPLMRPMFWDFPDDPESFEVDDQYMFGPDILVAPVASYGQRERSVYLPEGKWVFFGSSDIIEGGQTVTMDASLELVPAYLRADSEIAAVFAEK